MEGELRAGRCPLQRRAALPVVTARRAARCNGGAVRRKLRSRCSLDVCAEQTVGNQASPRWRLASGRAAPRGKSSARL